jgi:hypothetical protein
MFTDRAELDVPKSIPNMADMIIFPPGKTRQALVSNKNLQIKSK